MDEALGRLSKEVKSLLDMKAQIAEILKKLALKASTEDLENAKRQLREEFMREIDSLKKQLDKLLKVTA